MITEAGVPANKIVVGIASYGRSCGLEDPSRVGPECLFTGPNSTATPGECPVTAGYISQAELKQMSSSALARRDSSVTSWYDSSSDSDMMTYGESTWVAFMSQATKASRINVYSSYGFAVVVEWALDVATFVESENMTDANFNITQAEQAITEAISTSGYNISDFADFNLTILATALTGDDGCTELQKQQIRSGSVESWKIINYIYNVANAGIGFNEAAAVVTDVGKFNTVSCSFKTGTINIHQS